MSRLDRWSNKKVADIVIVVGLVLLAAGIINGVLNAYSFQYFQPGSDPSFTDRLQVFLNAGLNSLPWSALVFASGCALRMVAQRTSSEVASAATPTDPGPFGDTLSQSPLVIDRTPAPPNDDIWRR
jgi:hypothetical protein